MVIILSTNVIQFYCVTGACGVIISLIDKTGILMISKVMFPPRIMVRYLAQGCCMKVTHQKEHSPSSTQNRLHVATYDATTDYCIIISIFCPICH